MPTDPEALKRYLYDINKNSYKVRYTGIKVKKHKDLYNMVQHKLNLLTDDDFATLSRTMINRLKALNDALNGDYKFDLPDGTDTESILESYNTGAKEQDSNEGDNPCEVESIDKSKIKLTLKKSTPSP